MNIAIILAGGKGTRIGANIPKQFIKINDKPILAYTVEIFEKNKNIDAIEIVCHKDWLDEVKNIVNKYNFSKVKWLVNGGFNFQESTLNGILNLKGKISNDDIVVISFGVSPFTTDIEIDDSIDKAKKYGNGISARDIDLCTCIKEDEVCSSKNLIRESIKGFANPWSFKYGELLGSYEYAIENNMLKDLEPHTTSLYFALGKKIYFSKSENRICKITYPEDIDFFKGYLLLKEKKEW